MLSNKWLPLLSTQACSNSLEHQGGAEQLFGVRISLGQMEGPSWLSQEWPP